MVIFLITSFVLLAAIVFLVYRRQSRALEKRVQLPPPRATTLFDEDGDGVRRLRPLVKNVSHEARKNLLARAASGERQALEEAHSTGDAPLYEEVLNHLVESAVASAEPDKSLLALVSFVTRHEHFPVTRKLAASFMESWRRAPDRSFTAKMLHVAALANDAELYQEAVEAAFEFWRAGELPDVSAEELKMLADSEYWVLSSEARASGAGFLLKRTLSKIRRELESYARAS